ncbi:hypothetical protein K438DRAFT_1484469, partial [Mycena galopus ATCC 62051]
FCRKDSELREHELSTSEWDALVLVTGWLKYFRSATTQMSATHHSIGSVRVTDSLQDAIAELPATADPALRDGLVAAHLKLSDYYTKFDQSRYYL